METAVDALLVAIPFAMPLAAGGVLLAVCGLLALGAWVLLLTVYPAFRESMEGGNKDGGNKDASTTIVILAYTPALANLVTAFNLVVLAVNDAVSALGTLLSSDILRLIAVAILAVFAALFYYQHDVILQEAFTFTVCEVKPIWSSLLQIVNLLRLLLGAVVPAANLYNQFMWSLTGVLYRVVFECTALNAFGVVTNLLTHAWDALELLTTALLDFSVNGPLLTGRIDFLPFLAEALALPIQVAPILDCGCQYLSFVWTPLLELPQSLSLRFALDCALNAPLRTIQAVFLTIENNFALDAEPIVLELQCAVLNGGDFVEDAVFFVIDTLNSLVDLVPIASAPTLAAAATGVPRGSLARTFNAVWRAAPQTRVLARKAVAEKVDAAFVLFPNFNGTVLGLNLTDLLGLTLLLRIAEAPWSRIATEPAAGVLSVINGTLALALGGGLQFDATDIRFFQTGYIWDRVRNAGDALGAVGAVFTEDLRPVLADLINIIAGAAQIVTDLVVYALFVNIYDFPADGNPLAFAVDYCDSNTTMAYINYRVIYNHSASVAELLGCDPVTDSFPLQSQGATCNASVAGCIALSTYRTLAEAVDVVLKTACYFSELVQFNGTKTTFAHIQLDPFFRQVLHLLDCLKRFVWLFDAPGAGEPPVATCEYTNPTDGLPDWKRSLFCSVGNVLELGSLVVVALAYELLVFVRALLTTIALPSYSTNIKIPTLAASIDNLEPGLCQLGVFLGSLVPVSFSCSAQDPDFVYGGPPGPDDGRDPNRRFEDYFSNVRSVQTGERFATVAVSRRTSDNCAVPQNAWGGVFPYTPCNCTIVGQPEWGPTLANTLQPCMIECARPELIPGGFPYTVGTAAIPTECLGEEDAVGDISGTALRFSNATMLRRFLSAVPAPLPVPGGNNWAGIFVDPDGTFFYAREFQVVITARLNLRADAIFSAGVIREVSIGCDSRRWFNFSAPGLSNLTNDTYTLLQQRLLGMPYVELAHIAEFNIMPFVGASPDYFNVYGRMLLASLCQYTLDTEAYNFTKTYVEAGLIAGSIYSLPTVRIMIIDLLDNYNRAWGNCAASPANDTLGCIGGDSDTVANGLVTPLDQLPIDLTRDLAAVDTPFIVFTYSLTTLNSGTALTCNCSVAHYAPVDGNPSDPEAGACLLECDPPPLPLMWGRRRVDCLVPSCDNPAYMVWRDLPTFRAFVNRTLNATLAFPTPAIYERQVPVIEDISSVPGPNKGADLIRAMIEASLNVYYTSRYRPELAIFFRSVSDPLYGPACLPFLQDRELFANRRWDHVVRVLNETYMGVRTSATCAQHYAYSSPEFGFCDALVTALYWEQSLPSEAPNTTRWIEQTQRAIVPALNLIAQFRPFGSAFKQCFVVSESLENFAPPFVPPVTGENGEDLFNVPLPPLAFVAPQATRLPELDIEKLKACPSFVTCTERTLCTAARVLVVPLLFVSELLNEANKAIAGTAGTWTWSNDIWEILRKGLVSIWERAFVAVLQLLSWLDCLACAISLNSPTSPFCQSPLFGFWSTVAVLLVTLGTSIINLVVLTVRFWVLFFVYLFTGDFPELAVLLVEYLISIWNLVLLPVLKAIVGFFISTFGLCDLWRFLGFEKSSGITCRTGGRTRPRRKRSPEEAATEPAALLYLYQKFAPDWPANASTFAWAPAHPCAARMPLLAPAAASLTLTREASLEAAYCLAGVRVFGWPGSTAPILPPPPGSAADFNRCDYLMEHAGAESTPWSSLALDAKATLLQCIEDRAFGVVLRRTAVDGTLDWLPLDALGANGANPLHTGFRLMGHAFAGMEAAREHEADALATPATLASPEYRGAIAIAQGEQRASLVLAASDAAQQPPLSAYADAAANSEEAQPLVRSFARMVDRVRTQMKTDLIPRIMAEIDAAMASTPVLPASVGTAGVLGGARSATTIQLAEEEVAQANRTGIEGDGKEAVRAMLGSFHAAWHITHSLYQHYNSEKAASLLPTSTVLQSAGLSIKALGLLVYDLSSGRAVASALASSAASNVSATASTPSALSAHLRANPSILLTPGALGAALTAWKAAKVAAAAAPAPVAGQLRWETTPATRIALATAAAEASSAAKRPSFWARFVDGIPGTAPITRLGDPLRGLASYYARAKAHLATYDVRAVRMAEARRVYEQMVAAAYAPRAAVNEPTTVLPDTCLLNNSTLCTECYLLATQFGYWIEFVKQTADQYGNTAAQNATTVAYLYDDFLFRADYLADLDNALIPVRVGNSPLNPVRFPSLGRSVWDYLDDPIQGKIGVSDLGDLADRTWALIRDLFDSVTFDSGAFAIVSNSSSSVALASASASATCNASTCKTRPRPLSPTATNPMAALANVARGILVLGGRLVINGTAPVYETAAASAADVFAILSEWVEFFIKFFFRCNRLSGVDGTGLRFSIAIAAVAVGGVIGIPLLLFAIASPGPVSLTFTVASMVLGTFAINAIFALSTGWTLVCLPVISPALVNIMGMHLINEVVVTQCPVWGAGLVNEPSYTNDRCGSCANWRADEFTLANCGRDLGWETPLDFITFWLKVFLPEFLAKVSDPSFWWFPINLVVATETVQDWLHRWDDLDLTTDPIAYSQQYTCGGIITLSSIVLLIFAGLLLTIGPFASTFRLLLALLYFLVRTAALFVFPLAFVGYAAIRSASTMAQRRAGQSPT